MSNDKKAERAIARAMAHTSLRRESEPDERTLCFRALWTDMFEREFDTSPDWDNIPIPRMPHGPQWLIVVPAQLRVHHIVRAYRRRWDVEAPWHMETVFSRDTLLDSRPAQYACWTPASLYPDSRYLGTSALKLRKQEVVGMTLLERLLLEWLAYELTGQHPDTRTVTLCIGTRDVSEPNRKHTPFVRWSESQRKLSIGLLREDEPNVWCGARPVHLRIDH